MKPTNSPLVSVCSLTFNHAPFLERTLDGFLKQKTEFPIEIIIHDDASTDGTQDVLCRFERDSNVPVRILLEEKNQFSQGVNLAFDIMLPQIRGKYAAICEGDDWWISPEKLQRQISFMEAHPNCVLTVHNGIRFNSQTGLSSLVDPFSSDRYLNEEEIFFSFLNNPPTASFVIRVDTIIDYPEYLRRAPIFDDVIRLYCFEKGDVFYFHDLLSGRTFRHDGSWTRMLEEDLALYENYTIRLLEFYREHDLYTQKRHTELIDTVCRKIGKRFCHIAGSSTSKSILKEVCLLAGIIPEAIK